MGAYTDILRGLVKTADGAGYSERFHAPGTYMGNDGKLYNSAGEELVGMNAKVHAKPFAGLGAGIGEFFKSFTRPQTYKDWYNDNRTWANRAVSKIPSGGLRLLGHATDIGRHAMNGVYTFMAGRDDDVMNLAQPNMYTRAANAIDGTVGRAVEYAANGVNPLSWGAAAVNGPGELLHPPTYSQALQQAPGGMAVMNATENAVGEAIWPWLGVKAYKQAKTFPVKWKQWRNAMAGGRGAAPVDLEPTAVVRPDANAGTYETKGELYEHYTDKPLDPRVYSQYGDHIWTSPSNMSRYDRATGTGDFYQRPYREFYDAGGMQKWDGTGRVLLNNDEALGAFARPSTRRAIEAFKNAGNDVHFHMDYNGKMWHDGSQDLRQVLARSQGFTPDGGMPGILNAEAVGDTGPALRDSLRGLQDISTGYLYTRPGDTATAQMLQPAAGQSGKVVPWKEYWAPIENSAAIAGASGGRQ